MIEQVVITDAWLEHQGRLFLNPALKGYEKELLARRQQWSDSPNFTPLSWYAAKISLPAAALVAACSKLTLQQHRQFWLVSPYHARLTRSTLRVMPESMLDWSAGSAEKICELINPLLLGHGLKLYSVNGILLLGCDRVWDVTATDFADISGSLLPDRQPAGADAGSWMRLLSEIQMTLHQKPVTTDSGLVVHGLWFWAGSEHISAVDKAQLPAVATANDYLKMVLAPLDKEREATIIVSEADKLAGLLNERLALPKNWLLLGAGKSVKLSNHPVNRYLAKFKAQKWQGI